MDDVQDYVEFSKEFLRKNEPPEGYFVGFSGGKDSIAVLQVCREAGVKHTAYYTNTGIDAPEVVKFITKNYPDVIHVRPKVNFYAKLRVTPPPLPMTRWCCTYIKEKPSYIIPLNHRVFGVRAEESKRRAARGMMNTRTLNKKRTLTNYHPIFTWPEWAVWDFIESRGLKFPDLYLEGWNRIGCVLCPFSVLGITKPAIRRREISMERWPGMWRAFKNAVRVFWETRHASPDAPEKYRGESFEDYWNAYLNLFKK